MSRIWSSAKQRRTISKRSVPKSSACWRANVAPRSDILCRGKPKGLDKVRCIKFKQRQLLRSPLQLTE
eukprot:scaffold126132_cov69-Phaeocystis_antarctica.AAC.6